MHAVRAKLLMLVAPFLRRWNFTRVLEQVSLGACHDASKLSELRLPSREVLLPIHGGRSMHDDSCSPDCCRDGANATQSMSC